MPSGTEQTTAGHATTGSAEARPRTRMIFQARWVSDGSAQRVDDQSRDPDRPADDDPDAPDWWKEQR